MTTYEAIMIMLGLLTLNISILGIIVKLLLHIVENNAKNSYLCSGKFEIAILSI